MLKGGCENVTKQEKWKIPSKDETLMVTTYRLEFDVSPKIGIDRCSGYMSLIGILRWMVELGHVDLCLEGSNCFAAFCTRKKNTNEPDIDKFKFEEKVFTSSECLVDFVL